MKSPRINLLLLLTSGISLFFSTQGVTQELTRYMEPVRELAEIIDAKSTPVIRISPDNTSYILAQPQEMPDLSELAQPELRLAGLRINPSNFGTSRSRFYLNLSIHSTGSADKKEITNLPSDGLITRFAWSPDSKKIAIVIYKSTIIELWVASSETGIATRWGEKLNQTLINSPFTWLPDSKTIIYAAVPDNLGVLPDDLLLPEGPSVQQTSGKTAKVRTYQDLLKNPADEKRFEYYATSQLMKVVEGNKPVPIGNPAIINNISPSPDANYLLIEYNIRPYSYAVPAGDFPVNIEIWSTSGDLVKRLAEIPLTEDIPQGFSAVRKGPREFEWRSDVPATIIWAEAQDEGDPRKEAAVRDKIFSLDAPFRSEPVELLSLSLRYSGITWGWNTLAVVYERWWTDRRIITSFFNPSDSKEIRKVIWDRSWQDAYNDPGSFSTSANALGMEVLTTDKNKKILYLSGAGSSTKGDFPFLDQFEIYSKKITRLWQCEAPYYEYFIGFLDQNKRQIITSRESSDEQPNYFVRDIRRKKITQLTTFPHPYPMLKDIKKELVKYKREDGLVLTGTLYLPAGYVKGSSQLPVLMWAYPEEFVDPNLAGQVKGSPYRFIRPSRLSAILWVARGYAVFDNLGMPIVGKEGKEPNDSFIEQLVSNAKAAIDTLVEMKVADPKRVAIGGHSYGAFMTANLMAHCDLFAAGIARSGAYNRSLTPFGFQSEERTYWEAQEVYNKMSPFNYADKINEPLLLIHGEADNNSGTFPIQSERLYAAIKGHGGTTRLVILPYESHGYRARQSIMHVTWEMDQWLEQYVKNRK